MHGSCHCGRIQIEVDGIPDNVLVCNCSICTKKAYVHWIVPRQSFHLLTPAADVATYLFGTRVAKHHFCLVCGAAPYYVPRSDPGKVDVNVRCLDGVDLDQLTIETFDGKNWEHAFAKYGETRET